VAWPYLSGNCVTATGTPRLPALAAAPL